MELFFKRQKYLCILVCIPLPIPMAHRFETSTFSPSLEDPASEGWPYKPLESWTYETHNPKMKGNLWAAYRNL